jgi:hypothetical protein
MKTLVIAAMSALLLALPGCVHHHHGPAPAKHPHGAPPGQAKKHYRCGHCGATATSAISCHGKVMIVFD